MGEIIISKVLVEDLKRLFAEEQHAEERNSDWEEGLKKRFLDSKGILIKDEDGKEGLNPMTLLVLDTFFSCSAGLTCIHRTNGEEKKNQYCLRKDQIVLVQETEENYSFLWLPTVKFAMGALAGLMEGIGGSEESVYCRELEAEPALNSVEHMGSLFMDAGVPEIYQKILRQKELETFAFEGRFEGEQGVLYLLFKVKGNSVFWYQYRKKKVECGTGSYIGLVNRVGDWLIGTHRELIQNTWQEDAGV